MEDLNKLLYLSDSYPLQLEQLSEEFLLKLRVILWGQAAVEANKARTKDLQKTKEENKLQTKDLPLASPQQKLKRLRRLSSLNEDSEIEVVENVEIAADKNCTTVKCKRSNAELLAVAEAAKDINDGIISETPPVAAPRTLSVSSDFNNKENNVEETEERNSEETNLMPPPPIPVVEETTNKRPQRAAKIKSEKCLKEPTLKGKLRRATNEVKVKLEHETRASQMHADSLESSKLSVLKESNANMAKSSLSSERSNDSICVIPGKQPSIISINSDTEEVLASTGDENDKQSAKDQKKYSDCADNGLRELCVKIKREKVSLENQENLPKNSPDEAVFKLPAPKLLAKDETLSKGETSLASSILSTTSNANSTTAPVKKIRKKKDVVHRPIKVERFSDLNSKPSICTRTRQGTNKQEAIEASKMQEDTKRPGSVYEDAVNTPANRNSKEMNTNIGNTNQTVDLGPAADATINLGSAPNDATYCTNPAQTTFQVAPSQTTFVMDTNPNATITLNKQSGSGAPGDVTFDVHQASKAGKDNKEDEAVGQRSFETARDSSLPNENSLLTEDEEEKPIATKPKASTTQSQTKVAPKTASSAKAAYKMPTRANELFNPLAQSPVKMRVEAFENAAAAATEQTKRPLRIRKESATSNTTPVIGKLTAPALGRFLTPTQTSSLTAVNSSITKKTTTSASKALPISKLVTASSLQRSNSTASTKTINRENSGDDFRKGLHSLAEERKKQREQKHLLAAQQREAKERERTERMAKLAKEREEKRKLKKQQEQEQKKRELEEIQRKLQQQKEAEEEAAKLKAAKEREMMLQMKQQQQQLAKQKMLPPPPKVTSKYTFEMLHEDDSTDDEDKVTYKRPPPPSWSRSHVRGPFMLKQEYTPSAYIDSFFSVQPMTPDLKIIFPNIDARHLKRNSSVLWSTPPRYSELPKY